jgi:hypothetical protein
VLTEHNIIVVLWDVPVDVQDVLDVQDVPVEVQGSPEEVLEVKSWKSCWKSSVLEVLLEVFDVRRLRAARARRPAAARSDPHSSGSQQQKRRATE